MKILKSLLLLVLLCLFPTASWANAGLPMIVLGLPFLIAMLVPVVLIEVFVFKKFLNLPPKKLLLPILVANLISTLFGYPLAWVCQMILEFGTVGGGVVGIDTIWGKFASTILQSAWLIPYDEPDMKWMVPIAGLFGLIPAYFISVWSESFVIRKIWKFGNETRKVTWRANAYSYIPLATILISTLIYGLVANR